LTPLSDRSTIESVRLHLLGPVEVDGTSRGLAPRDRVVISALAVRLGQRVDAQELADALWGEQLPASWPKVVQGCISRLRRDLGGDAIETSAGGYRLRAEAVWLDTAEFEALVKRGREHAANRSPERAITSFNEALALWRGPAYDVLAEWLPARLESIRLNELRLSAEEELLQARLDAGDHRGAATAGLVLAREQPYRERRWTLLALAQYRSERQADALASIRTARRLLGQELGLDPGSELVELESAILAQDPALAAGHETRLVTAECPWKGLAFYGPEDHDGFFGRDRDIEACLTRLRESPLLVVTGPSGCGKSSLVHAGLVATLRRDERRVEVFTPGPDGASAMAAARSRAADPVLVVDQFEEAFTVGADVAARRAWLGEIVTYATTTAPVVLAIRSDFVAALSEHVELARLTERGLHLVTPLQGAALREVVEAPARLAGLRVEPGLVELLLRDAQDQAGALPLLSHALTETWRRRDSGTLTVDGYREAGGIQGAVAASAERLYDGLTADGRADLRWLMLRLVSLSETGEAFRTRLPVSAASEPARRRLLDLLVRSRLVTAEADHYEVAHEALARAWPRLRTWLDEDAAGQRVRRHLAVAAAGWEAAGRDQAELYRGARLQGLLEWLDREREPLTDTESAFVESSRAVAEDDLRTLAAQARRQRIQNRRLQALVAGALVLLLVAATAAGLAVQRGREAAKGRDASRASELAAEHEALVARSAALGATNRAVGALLAVEAWRERPDRASLAALIGSVHGESGFLGYRSLPLSIATTVDAGPFPRYAAAAIPASDQILVAIGSTVARVDPATGDAVSAAFARGVAEGGRGSVLRVSSDGTRAAQLLALGNSSGCQASPPPSDARHCTVLVVYDIETGRRVLGPVPTPLFGADVAISSDGHLVAVVGGADGEVVTWDVETQTQLGRLPGLARPPGLETSVHTGSVAFGHGHTLYVGSLAGPVRELSARTLRVSRSLPGPPLGANRRLIATSSGQLVASGDRGEAAWSLPQGRLLWTTVSQTDGSGCVALAVSEALDRSHCANALGAIVERDLRTGQPTGVVRDLQGAVDALTVTQDGHELVAMSAGWVAEASYLGRWRLDGPGVGGRLLAPGVASTGGYSPDGRLVLVSGARPGASEVLDADGQRVLRLKAEGTPTWLSNETIAAVGIHAVLVDVPSGQVRSAAALGRRTVAIHSEPQGTQGWAVSRNGESWTVSRFEVASGATTPTSVTLLNANEVTAVSDGRSLVVTALSEGDWGSYVLDVDASASATVDVAQQNGNPELAFGLSSKSLVAITPNGSYIAADDAGQVEEHADFYLPGHETFPGARSGATSLQLNTSGSRLLVTSLGAVQLYDTSTKTALGDPLSTDSPDGVTEGWLRPDGERVLVNTRNGVVELDLDPDRLLQAACQLAGRDLTMTEWSTYVGAEPYRSLCPEFGLPPVY
jgi:DNA-binding SARP family transcriptional activator/WD40 repeat protein